MATHLSVVQGTAAWSQLMENYSHEATFRTPNGEPYPINIED